MKNLSSSMASIFLDRANIPDSQAVKSSIENRINFLGIEGVFVDEVEVDIDGDIIVTFVDEDDDEMDVVFAYDPEDGAIAIIQDDDDDAEDSLIVDLGGLAPSVTKTPFGTYLNLIDLSWMNKSAFLTLFQAGQLDNDDDDDVEDYEDNSEESEDDERLPDPYGYIDTSESVEENEEHIDEARKVYVVRGGKKLKLAIVRKVRRKILTGKQKAGIRKAVMKRKAKKSVTSRKRKRSLRVRSRLKLKKPKNLAKGQKVAGTANRKR